MLNPALEGAVGQFLSTLSETEREARSLSSTIPHEPLRGPLIKAFWDLMSSVESIEASLSEEERSAAKSSFQTKLLPFLGRSKLFSRSLLKPNGYSGDFLIVEWMYALEDGDCHDPFQISFVNLLDSVFRTIHSVESIWERRKWLADLLVSEIGRRSDSGATTRILDIACGSARYISDALRHLGPDRSSLVHVTLCDQDPAAIAYAEHLLSGTGAFIEANCIPVKRLSSVVTQRRFEVIVASGLFDYFSTRHTSRQVGNLVEHLSPEGVLAFTNYTPEDKSALAKEWIAEWSLIFKDETEIRSIMEAARLQAELLYSKNRSLIMAVGRSTQRTPNSSPNL